MKAKEIPLQNLTVAALMALQRHGVKGIIDGDKRVLRIVLENGLDTLETKSEVLLERLN
jgi:hypothetical protein